MSGWELDRLQATLICKSAERLALRTGLIDLGDPSGMGVLGTKTGADRCSAPKPDLPVVEGFDEELDGLDDGVKLGIELRVVSEPFESGVSAA